MSSWRRRTAACRRRYASIEYGQPRNAQRSGAVRQDRKSVVLVQRSARTPAHGGRSRPQGAGAALAQPIGSARRAGARLRQTGVAARAALPDASRGARPAQPSSDPASRQAAAGQWRQAARSFDLARPTRQPAHLRIARYRCSRGPSLPCCRLTRHGDAAPNQHAKRARRHRFGRLHRGPGVESPASPALDRRALRKTAASESAPSLSPAPTLPPELETAAPIAVATTAGVGRGANVIAVRCAWNGVVGSVHWQAVLHYSPLCRADLVVNERHRPERDSMVAAYRARSTAESSRRERARLLPRAVSPCGVESRIHIAGPCVAILETRCLHP